MLVKNNKKINQISIDNPKTKTKKLTWVNVNNASKKEIIYLRKKYKFELVHLEASLGKKESQRTFFEKSKDYLFIILQFPVRKNGRITVSEIDFFFSNDYLITLHNKNKQINNLFNTYKKDKKSTLAYDYESPRILLFDILNKLTANTLSLLDEISKDVNEIEEYIFAHKQKQAVAKILETRRNIINFRKIIQNHSEIIEKIMNSHAGKLITAKLIKEHYGKLLEYSDHIWNTLENRRENIEILNSTNESIMNYRLNNTMKTLTVFSVVVFPLTLIAALFGMNTGGIPFVDSPNGFWYVVGIMSSLGLLMLLYFRKKKWL